MGRSPTFCFSIRACVGDADEDDFSTLQEIKESPHKRRWSLRKKSFGHHVPSNTVISEPLPIFSDNQNQEATANAFYAPSNTLNASIVEQTSPTLQVASPVVSSSVPMEFTSASTVLVDYNIPEHAVIVIQTSIRRCLAQEELQKLKNVVKLQAAVRGYLVRRQAAGTLRCIQAIVKMQALIRTRRSVILAELTNKSNHDEYVTSDVVGQSNMKLNKTSSAISKLVSSPYARQLLGSTPKTKPIHISCDPLRPDSAWNLLERWMALSSTDQQKDVKTDLASYDDDVKLHATPTAPVLQTPLHVRTPDVKLAVKNSPAHSQNESNARNSAEHLRKGTKNVRRPNSSGTNRTNPVDHEDISSINSVPSYMQPTESTKAKANTAFSKKSSIDLYNKDDHIKKKHSTGIQSSSSQASQFYRKEMANMNDVSFRTVN